MSVVHVLVPDGLDDPARPSGGNLYDRRVCDGLAASGWEVVEHPAPGSWPRPGRRAEAGLARLVASLPDGAVLLADGLIASTAPSVLVPAADRLRLVVLLHLALGDGPPGHRVVDARQREGAVLSAAAGVVVTSSWLRARLLACYPLPPDGVHVAEPGVDRADPVPGSAGGGHLLCVAAVTAHKGHDVLLAALTDAADLDWRCACVGTLDREPAFVDRLRQRAGVAGVADRFCLDGPRTGHDLDQAYAAADVLVLASLGETYGMVVTEALARGLPVIATAVGGLPEALGRTAGGRRPGLLVPPGDPAALAGALRRWLSEEDLRRRLRQAAGERRVALTGWARTAAVVGQVLTDVAREGRAA